MLRLGCYMFSWLQLLIVFVRRALIVLSSLALCLSACDSQPASKAELFAQRKTMVEEQLAAPGRDIRNRRVLEAMAAVPRHEFVPKALWKSAYSDDPLPIGYGQTISQPFIVAFMTEQLDPKPTDRVLEIGTGSGYQSAVLSRLVAEVYTIEKVYALNSCLERFPSGGLYPCLVCNRGLPLGKSGSRTNRTSLPSVIGVKSRSRAARSENGTQTKYDKVSATFICM